MRVSFEDYYGQKVTVHDETGSGNIRIEVKTSKSLNDVRAKPEAEWELIETDISLDAPLLKILIGALQKMEDE